MIDKKIRKTYLIINDLRDRIVFHTESAPAARILNQWEMALQNFWQVVPTEIIPVLDVPFKLEDELSETA